MPAEGNSGRTPPVYGERKDDMKIEVKRSASGQYREAKATDGGTTIDLGLLNHQDCGDLAESLLSTVLSLIHI